MNKQYILSIKQSFLTEEFFIKSVDKYDPGKHGIEKLRIELDNPTKKELSWNLRNFMDMWSFLH